MAIPSLTDLETKISSGGSAVRISMDLTTPMNSKGADEPSTPPFQSEVAIFRSSEEQEEADGNRHEKERKDMTRQKGEALAKYGESILL